MEFWLHFILVLSGILFFARCTLSQNIISNQQSPWPNIIALEAFTPIGTKILALPRNESSKHVIRQVMFYKSKTDVSGASVPEVFLYVKENEEIWLSENLQKFIPGGYFTMRISFIKNTTVENRDYIILPISRGYKNRLVLQLHPDTVYKNQNILLDTIASSINVLTNERHKAIGDSIQFHKLKNGSVDYQYSDFCFTVVSFPGVPTRAQQILDLFEANKANLRDFYSKFKISGIEECTPEVPVTDTSKSPNNLVGTILVISAVILGLFVLLCIVFLASVVLYLKKRVRDDYGRELYVGLHKSRIEAIEKIPKNVWQQPPVASPADYKHSTLPMRPTYVEPHPMLGYSAPWAAAPRHISRTVSYAPSFRYRIQELPNSPEPPPLPPRPSSMLATYEWQESSLQFSESNRDVSRSSSKKTDQRTKGESGK